MIKPNRCSLNAILESINNHFPFFIFSFRVLLFLICVNISTSAQNVGINGTGAIPDASAMLDINSSNTGLLIPRIALTANNISAPVIAPATSLLIYNIATDGIVPNNVTPGYYYWNGALWIKLNGDNWSLTGNSGTVDGVHFIGSVDNIPLNFRVNNQKAGRIDPLLFNTFFGYEAGNITSGFENSAIGYRSLYSNTAGFNNIGIGSYSLYSNTIGHSNTGIGFQSLFSNISGIRNTGNGAYALLNNTVGAGNTASGYYSLFSNTIGTGNTANGIGVLQFNTTGEQNTAVGGYSLYSNSIGSYNTAIGYIAFNSGPTVFNSTALGYGATITSNNEVKVGNASVTSIGGQVGWTTISDKRVKENVQYNVPGLSFINALKPVTYCYNVQKQCEIIGQSDSSNYQSKDNISKIVFSGFLAQDVDSVAKEIGYDFSGVDKSATLWGLRYAEFVVPLVKAVQEQQQIISEQNDLLNKQQIIIDNFEKRLRLIEEKRE